MKNNDSKKAGFTLVELSIVLVIIGLLIGGLLTAQSMIETTRVQSTIRMINQYDIAAQNFKSRYGGLPGDSTLFGGNGDGKITSGTETGWLFSGETANFWGNLKMSGFAHPSNFSNTLGGGGFVSKGSTINAPTLPLSNPPAVVAHVIYDNINVRNSSVNGYMIGVWEGVALGGGNNMAQTATGSIRTSEALAIDAKMDDGNAVTGKVSSSLFGYQTGLGCWNRSTCGQGGIYDGDDCILSITMFEEKPVDPVCEA